MQQFMKVLGWMAGRAVEAKVEEVPLPFRIVNFRAVLQRFKSDFAMEDLDTFLEELLFILEQTEAFTYTNFLATTFPNLNSLFRASASVQRNWKFILSEGSGRVEVPMTTTIPEEIALSISTKYHLQAVILLESALIQRLDERGISRYAIPFLTNIYNVIPDLEKYLNELLNRLDDQIRFILLTKTAEVKEKRYKEETLYWDLLRQEIAQYDQVTAANLQFQHYDNRVLSTLDQWEAVDELINQLDETQQLQIDILTQVKDLLFTLQAAYDVVNHISQVSNHEA